MAECREAERQTERTNTITLFQESSRIRAGQLSPAKAQSWLLTAQFGLITPPWPALAATNWSDSHGDTQLHATPPLQTSHSTSMSVSCWSLFVSETLGLALSFLSIQICREKYGGEYGVQFWYEMEYQAKQAATHSLQLTILILYFFGQHFTMWKFSDHFRIFVFC